MLVEILNITADYTDPAVTISYPEQMWVKTLPAKPKFVVTSAEKLKSVKVNNTLLSASADILPSGQASSCNYREFFGWGHSLKRERGDQEFAFQEM